MNSATSPTPAETYFPAIDGSRWKWRKTITIGDETGPLKPSVFTSTLESRLVGQEQVEGVLCFRVETADEFGSVVQTELLSIRPDGHYRHSMNKDRFTPPARILALPAKVGTHWKNSFTIQEMRLSTSSKIEAEETVTVPAGTFETIRVKVDAGLLTTTTWYAPGIGVVKQSVDKSIQSQRDDTELEEFTPGDAPSAPKSQ